MKTWIVMGHRALFLVLYLLLFNEVLVAKIQPLIHAEEWFVQGCISQIIAHDINRDKRQDLLIISHMPAHDSGQRIRQLSIFLNEPETDQGQAHQRLPLFNAIAFDLADLNGDGNDDFTVLCSDGVYAYLSDSEGYLNDRQLFIQTESVFPGADLQRLVRYPFIQDLNGDTLPEILIPTFENLSIYQKSDSSYQLIRDCLIRPRYQFLGHKGMDLIIQPPELHFIDFDGDRRQDLIHLFEDHIQIFLNPSLMNYSNLTLLPDLEFDFGSRRIAHSALDQTSPVSHHIRLHDLNADGYMDCIVSQAARSGYVHTISQLHLYLNQEGMLASFPDYILTAENYAGEHFIQDLNGDGLQDLILFNLDIGYTAAARLILTRRFTHQYEIYLMREDCHYPSKPDSKLSVKIDPRERPLVSMLYALSLIEDFNGDGSMDLLVADKKTEWILYPGTPVGEFNSKEKSRIRTTTLLDQITVDLNSDGAADLIQWDKEDARGAIKLLLSEQDSDS